MLMPAGKVEEKEGWFGQNQDRVTFLFLQTFSKISDLGTMAIDT
jgi:hypothetical protein